MFYIFLRFTLLVRWEKNILANLTNSQEPEPVGAGATWKKTRSRSRLGKKSGAGATWKKSGAGAGKQFAGSPALLRRDSYMSHMKKKTLLKLFKKNGEFSKYIIFLVLV